MELLTKVDIPHASKEITYQDKILLIGSCFADNMTQKLADAFFQVSNNPFGTLYNPLSIAQCITLLQQTIDSNIDSVMQQLPIVFHNGLYHSLLHHGQFSSPRKESLLNQLQQSLEQGAKILAASDVLILTFGSARVYEYEKQIVGNCHRLPASSFTYRRLSVEEIVTTYRSLLALPTLRNKRIIFTVSPIRHRKDGLHQNQLSKSILLLAIEQLLTTCTTAECTYFPAYEILMDELRDYRFYDTDMLHPSAQAVDYIWERFGETWLSIDTRTEIKTLLQLRKMHNHKPLHPDGEEYKAFRQHTNKLLSEAQSRYPWIKPSN